MKVTVRFTIPDYETMTIIDALGAIARHVGDVGYTNGREDTAIFEDHEPDTAAFDTIGVDFVINH